MQCLDIMQCSPSDRTECDLSWTILPCTRLTNAGLRWKIMALRLCGYRPRRALAESSGTSIFFFNRRPCYYLLFHQPCTSSEISPPLCHHLVSGVSVLIFIFLLRMGLERLFQHQLHLPSPNDEGNGAVQFS